MTISHVEAAKWNTFDWSTKVTHSRPSGDGAVGVLFVWTDPAPFDIPRASFVVKPLGGSAVSTRFAEQVLKKVAGADSPDSIELKEGSPGYTGVKTLMYKLMKSGDITPLRAAPYLSAGAFVLQKMMHGYQEMSDAYRSGPDRLRQLLADAQLMTNLGRLGAADLILGNGDRIENGNFGNIMFNPDGTVAAIDSASILASFNQLADASDMPNMDHFGNAFMNRETPARRGEWVEAMARTGGVAAPTNAQIGTFQAKQANPQGVAAPVLAPMARMSAVEKGQHGLLFEQMKDQLEGRIQQAPLDAPINAPTVVEWSVAKENFVRGFTAGLAAIDTLLGGKAWMKDRMIKTMKSSEWRDLKKSYKNVGYSGEDPNLSWLSLVVRREIYRGLRRGLSMSDAIKAGQALAERKQAKAQKAGNTWRRG